jgi:hypothetical protein
MANEERMPELSHGGEFLPDSGFTAAVPNVAVSATSMRGDQEGLLEKSQDHQTHQLRQCLLATM